MLKDFKMIKQLVGTDVTEEDLKYVDCYVRPQFGLFIPIAGSCKYAANNDHTHPSYMIVIYFGEDTEKKFHYHAEISSPEISHNDKTGQHYYCLLIEKEYFEKCYRLYSNKLPVFREHSFEMCSDILKTVNTFAFEYSKSMLNSDITLDANADIITHWIIRSIFGETLDMRAISNDYSVARAQQYMEQHYAENITVSRLAKLGYVSPSCFNRRFKKEVGITPVTVKAKCKKSSKKARIKGNEKSPIIRANSLFDLHFDLA